MKLRSFIGALLVPILLSLAFFSPNSSAKISVIEKDGLKFKLHCIYGVNYLTYHAGNGHRGGLMVYHSVAGGVRQCSGFDTLKFKTKCIDNVVYILYPLGLFDEIGMSPMYSKSGSIKNCTYNRS